MAWYDQPQWWQAGFKAPATATMTGTTAGAAPTLTGTHGAGNEAYGYRPLVPDPLSSAHTAITGNTQNLGNLYGLAGGLNQFNEQQLIDQLVQGLPGYQANIGQASANTASNLAGQLPPDVIRQMQIRAAERGIAAPGPNANAAYLAAIGRNSLDLQNLGDQQLTAQIARTPKAPLYDPSQMFVQPDQIQQAASAANLYASAPNPAAAAAERLRIAQQFGSQTPTVGGLMGVNRGFAGPATPYDMPSPGVVGPYGGGGYDAGAVRGMNEAYTPPWMTAGTMPDQFDQEYLNEIYGGQSPFQQPDQGFESSEYGADYGLNPGEDYFTDEGY